MCVLTSYTPLGISRHPAPEKAYFFIMNSLLLSRMEGGYPTNDEFSDEDVNVYLAGLLASMIYPGYRESPAGRIAATDASLAEEASGAGSIREKYLLYRMNADNILVSLSIFKNARGKRPNSTPHLSLSQSAYLGRGKAYYAIARSYASQVYRKNTAIGEVLGKLSDRFERYVKVLSLMGSEHFNIIKQITDGELYHLENSSRAVEGRTDLRAHYDRFLDVYSSYLRKKSPRTKKALVSAVREMRTLDPHFDFNVEERERISSPGENRCRA